MEFIVGVLPDLLHIVPVSDDTVSMGYFRVRIRTSLALGLISDVQTVSEKNIQWDFHPQEKIEI